MIYFRWLLWLEVKETEFVREMLHNTLKFPEFEVVTLWALIWRNLIWGFDMNNINLMPNVTGNRRNEICKRNVAYHFEVPWVWGSDPGSLDLKDSDVRIWYEWYIFMMSDLIESGRNEICERNVEQSLEVPWVWSSYPGSLDLGESDMRIWYEWYVCDISLNRERKEWNL